MRNMAYLHDSHVLLYDCKHVHADAVDLRRLSTDDTSSHNTPSLIRSAIKHVHDVNTSAVHTWHGLQLLQAPLLPAFDRSIEAEESRIPTPLVRKPFEGVRWIVLRRATSILMHILMNLRTVYVRLTSVRRSMVQT